ncbi:uncharacterized protein LOC132047541 [Lycium ferocissimum]|uniref:uncharacterized protein LOC132047541 n=1 Tax=Lycium ferocissimum TaxID=112874 RepID=UPI0028167F90|nr:uncharacterized protein LOC132047541 [Lycium ferocissimum]
MNSLERVLPNDLIQGVMDTEIGERQLPDKSIWTPTTNGNFTCSSAWQTVRQKQEVDPLAKMIWAKGTPLKISFFMWRLLRKKLHLDDRILSLGIQTDSNCNCCGEQISEKVDHVFATSPFAVRIWKQMATPPGISHQGNSVQRVLDCWWRASISKRFSKVNNNWNWATTCQRAESYKENLTSMMLYWDKPSGHSWKLNTDGSYMERSRASGMGELLGREMEEWLWPLLNTSNAPLTIPVNYKPQCMDSSVNMLKGNTTEPWRIRKTIEAAQRIIQQKQIKVQHCYKEANAVADNLAKRAALNVAEDSIFLHEDELPENSRGPLRMDLLHLASFRLKACKYSGWYFEPP